MKLQTFTGRAFSPLAPKATDIAIEDIAHALSMACRFGGHVSTFYSVAQHSVLASHVVPREHALWALLHDASEAYLGDVTTPLKVTGAMTGYRAVESLLQQTIIQAFGLAGEQPQAVTDADLALLLLEADALLPGGPGEWAADLRGRVPVPQIRILPVDPPRAERAFLRRFEDLTAPPKP